MINKINNIDRIVRKRHPVGMRSSTDLTIEFQTGFELFNTRPYHNYETWSQGWYVKEGNRVIAKGETLEECLNDLYKVGVKDEAGNTEG